MRSVETPCGGGRPGPHRWPLPTRHLADPLAALDAAQRRAVELFLRRQGGGRSVDALTADLDGDGRSEVVLLWRLLGPASCWSALTVLAGAGQQWRDAASAALAGRGERLAIEGGVVHVDTQVRDPDDPGADVAARRVQRLRFAGGRLLPALR